MQYNGKEITPDCIDNVYYCPGNSSCAQCNYWCKCTHVGVSKGSVCLPAIRAMREENERLRAENKFLKSIFDRLEGKLIEEDGKFILVK